MTGAWGISLLVVGWTGLLWGQVVHSLPRYGGGSASPWYALESGPIVVYYTVGQEGLAKEALLYARDAYDELVHLFDYQPEGQVALRLHPTLYSYGHTPPWKVSSTLSAPSNLAEIARLADKPAFVGQVRSEVAALFLTQFYYGRGVRFQNRTLLYLPDWFLWGFAFFWGEGWTAADQTRLSIEHPLPLKRLWQREAAPSPTYRSLYKAIWYWIYRTYGQKKLIDLLYMVQLTRQISEALSLTLNITEEELTEKWLEFLGTFRRANLSMPEKELMDTGTLAILSAAVSLRDELAVAAWEKRTSRIGYWYFSAERGWVRLPGDLPWVERGGYYGFYELRLPLAYSPQGQLAWVSYGPTSAMLWVWNPAGEAGARRHTLSLKGIQSLSWQDEETVLLIGWEDAEAQVYAYDVRRERLRALTQTPGDKKDVFWTGRTFCYFWQADSMNRAGYTAVWQPYGWAEGTGIWAHREALHDWGGGWLKRGDTIISGQNLEGWWRPWIVTPDTLYPSTWGVPTFIQWIGWTGDKAYYLYYQDSEQKAVGYVSWAVLLQGGVSYPDVIAAEGVQMRLQRLSRYVQLTSPKPKVDTMLQDTPRKARGVFYYFDEDYERPRRRNRRQVVSPPPRGKYFSPDSVQAQNAGRARPQGLWQGIRVVPVLHPLMRLGLHTHVGVQTFSGRYEMWGSWRPYVDLRSAELWLGFRRQVGWWRPYLQAHRQMHYFSATRYGQGLRILSWTGEGGLKFILGPQANWAITAAGLLLHSRRYVLILRDQDIAAGEALWIGGRIGAHYQHYHYREGFLWRGQSLSLQAESYRRGSESGFGIIQAAGSWHQPIFSWLVGDLSVQAALGSPTNPRYFLLGGIPHWINYEVLNRSQLPLLGPAGGYYLNTFVTLPGYPYHARQGRNLLIGNVALRIPLLAGNPPAILPTRPIYNLEWKIALYTGTVWSTGNPFSQKNPIDAEYIYRPPLVISVQTLRSPFLISFGTGVKFRLMGLPIEGSLFWPVEDGRVGKVQFLLGFQAPLP